MAYPTTFDSFDTPAPSDPRNDPSLAGLIAQLQVVVGTIESTLGLTPQGSLATVAARLSYIAATAVPTGVILDYMGQESTVPGGWLLCYGQTVSRTTYSSLFSVIGTKYGVGDGSTTFALPDLRGRVAIGFDNMGGSAADRVALALYVSGDASQIVAGGSEVHLHAFASASGSTALTTITGGSHTHNVGATSFQQNISHTHTVDPVDTYSAYEHVTVSANPPNTTTTSKNLAHTHDGAAHTHAGAAHTHVGAAHTHDTAAQVGVALNGGVASTGGAETSGASSGVFFAVSASSATLQRHYHGMNQHAHYVDIALSTSGARSASTSGAASAAPTGGASAFTTTAPTWTTAGITSNHNHDVDIAAFNASSTGSGHRHTVDIASTTSSSAVSAGGDENVLIDIAATVTSSHTGHVHTVDAHTHTIPSSNNASGLQPYISTFKIIKA